MSGIKVLFAYHTGITQWIFRNPRLLGTWNNEGRHSDDWRSIPMQVGKDGSGCAYFWAEAEFAPEEVGKTFAWRVLLDADSRPDLEGLTTESGPPGGNLPYALFTLDAEGSRQEFFLAPGRSLGANKFFHEGSEAAAICFAVWAPHAQKVELVTAAEDSGGYIWNDGRGVKDTFPMRREAGGVWSTDPADQAFADYGQWKHRQYMFKITREDGSVAYRTDMYSRCQAGSGGKNPEQEEWDGRSEHLDSTKSCSVIIDPDMVNAECRGQELSSCQWLPEEEFWKGEFDPLRTLPAQIDDMVIYEMHVAGLGAGRDTPGNLNDAMGMLDYLVDLGVNAVELMPMSGFEGIAGWGYGTAHYYAIKYDNDGRDQFKHFVRACHRRGIAVIVDVVYNHYTPDSERSQWMYDSNRHDHNIYYYYTGQQSDYPPDFPDGGYCDNQSTGYLPNMAEEKVRRMMIGGALAMAMEFHVDGFRMDLTQALHSYNVRHLDGAPVPAANEDGIRFMREWARSLRLCKPHLMLLAEDHSGWNMMARSPKLGGMGFNATWWSEWYHQLIGDATQDASKARLLLNAGYGTNQPLKMDMFAGMLLASPRRVVYHESHDEAGNSEHSERTIMTAVNDMLFDNTRQWAEARCRVVAGLTILSAGTPMFFMGEEVGAKEPYRHDDFLQHREDFQAMRQTSGAKLFRFYRDIIRLRLETPAFRCPSIEVIKTHNADRVLAFRRWWGDEEFVVVACLSNRSFDNNYSIAHRSLKGKAWCEMLNSDHDIYGGTNMLNSEIMDSANGRLPLRIPGGSIMVLARVN